MAVLERYEWCDFWWEQTDKIDKKRVLLIGDSITKSYRQLLNDLLKEKAYVDMLATSKSLDNPSLKYEIDYMLKVNPFRYNVIHINNGLHGMHLSEEDYEKWLDEIVSYLIKTDPNLKVVLTLTTPVTEEGNICKINELYNPRVVVRNEAAVRIGRKHKLPVDDLYTPMFDKSEYKSEDGWHFNEAGQKKLAQLVMEILEPLLGIDK